MAKKGCSIIGQQTKTVEQARWIHTPETKLSQTTDLNATSRMKVECWQLPPTTFVKCNIDVAVFMQEHRVNMEPSLRNEIGK
jgi:hypothetical protein